MAAALGVSMDYLTLQQQAQRSIDSLARVLAGTPSGALRPRQDFGAVQYTVTAAPGRPLFTTVNGKPEAQWSILAGDPALAKQLGGNTALFLGEVTFVLDGASDSGEVELRITTSGRHENVIDGMATRFVSQAVSMNNFYTPGALPHFISSWSFADPASYMMPTPYTTWTLVVDEGNWQQVASITMTLSGKFLQNRTGLPKS